ncbi:GNAT family N-acetyltransferase [Streptomyces sp. NPDC060031]|uniref:GNAT family N-acetyltransferase n=1 Tax=Streptomyces sp. NPDC060031 TaxID=3347043 RepID=UPI00368D8631
MNTPATATAEAQRLLFGRPACDYLATCHESGVLTRTPDGDFCAGDAPDPLTRTARYFVEYAQPRLLTSPTGPGRLPAAAPPSAEVVLRSPADTRLPAPWQPLLTYLVRTGPAATAVPQGAGHTTTAEDDGISPATAADEPLVQRWMELAISDASVHQTGTRALDGAVREQAGLILGQPGRLSLIARADGRPIGHATLDQEAHDDITGVRFLELIDILVDPEHDVRAVTARLTQAAIERADRLGLPLVGHVVHQQAAPEHGPRIIASLTARGWQPLWVYWRHPAKDAR